MTSVGSVQISLILEQGRLNQQLQQAQQRLAKISDVVIHTRLDSSQTTKALEGIKSQISSNPLAVPIVANPVGLIAALRSIPVPTLRVPVEAELSNPRPFTVPINVRESDTEGLTELVRRLKARIFNTKDKLTIINLPVNVRESRDESLTKLIANLKSRIANPGDSKSNLKLPVSLELLQGEVARLRAEIQQQITQAAPRPGEIRSQFNPPDVQAAAGGGDQQQFKLEPKDLSEFRQQIEGLSAEEISVRFSRKDLQRFGKELRTELQLATQDINVGATNLKIAESIQRELQKATAETKKAVAEINQQEVRLDFNTAELRATDKVLSEIQSKINELRSTEIRPQVELGNLARLKQELEANQSNIRELSTIQIAPQVRMGELQLLIERLDSIKRRLRNLGTEVPTLSIQSSEAIAQVQTLEARLTQLLRLAESPLTLRANTTAALQALDALRTQVQAIESPQATAITISVQQAQQSIAEIEAGLARIQGLAQQPLQPQIVDAPILAKLEQLQQRLSIVSAPQGIQIDASIEAALERLDQVQQRLNRLSEITPTVRFNLTSAREQITSLQNSLRELKTQIPIQLEISQARGQVGRIQEQLQSLKSANPALDADIGPIAERLQAMRQQLEGLGNLRPTLDVDVSRAIAKLENLEQRLSGLRAVQPQVTLNIQQAVTALQSLRQELQGTRSQSALNVQVGVIGNLRGITADLGALSQQLRNIKQNRSIDLQLGETGANRTLNLASGIARILLDLDRAAGNPINFRAFEDVLAKTDRLRDGLLDLRSLLRDQIRVQADQSDLLALNQLISVTSQNLRQLRAEASKVISVNTRSPQSRVSGLGANFSEAGSINESTAALKENQQAVDRLFKTRSALTKQRVKQDFQEQAQAAREAANAQQLAAERTAQAQLAIAQSSRQSTDEVLRGVQQQRQGLVGLLRDIQDELLTSTRLIISFGASFALINAPIQLVKNAQDLERFTTGLNAASGSAVEGAQNLAFVRAEVNRLALPLSNSAKNFTALAAAAEGTVLEGEGVEQIFTGIAQKARVLGLTAEQQDKAFLALTQSISKTGVKAEELTGQLSEAVPGIVQSFAKALNIAPDVLLKRVTEGKIGFQELVALGKQLEKETSGALPAALDDSAAAVSRLQTSVSLLSEEVVNLGVITAGINTLTSTINLLSSSADILPSILLAIAATGLGPLIKNLQIAQTVQAAFNAALGRTATVGGTAAASLTPLQARLAGVTQEQIKASQASVDLRNKLGSIASVAGQIGILTLAFEALNRVLILTQNQAQGAKQVTDELARSRNKLQVSRGEKPTEAIGAEKALEEANKRLDLFSLSNIPVIGVPFQAQALKARQEAQKKIFDNDREVVKQQKLVNETLRDGEALLQKQAKGYQASAAEILNQTTTLDENIGSLKRMQPESRGQAAAIDALVKRLEQQRNAFNDSSGAIQETIKSIKDLQSAYEKASDTIASRQGVFAARIQEDLAKGIISEQQALERTAANVSTFGQGQINVNNRLAQELKGAELTEDFTAEDRQKELNRIALENAQIRTEIAEAEKDRRVGIEQDRAEQVERIAARGANELAIKEARANTAINRALAAGAITPDQSEEARLDVRRQALEQSFAQEQQNLKRLQGLRFSDVKAQQANDDKIAQSRRNLAQLEAELAQSEVEIRNQANQRILESAEQRNRRIEAGDKQSQNARIAAIRRAQRDRLLTEERAAAEIARITTTATAVDIDRQNNRLREIRALADARVITAKEASQQELEIRTNLSSLEVQLLENQLAEEAALRQRQLTRLQDLQETQNVSAQAIIAGIENQTKAIERQSAVIDRQKQLLESRQALFEAQLGLRQTGEQINIDKFAAALGIIEQLNAEEEKSVTQQIGLQKVLEAITGKFTANEFTQLETVQRRQAAENRLAKIQQDNLLAQQAAQRTSLELDLQRNKILAEQAVLQAEIAKQQAAQNALAAQFKIAELAIDPNTRPEQLANAQKLAELAALGVNQSEAAIGLARDNAAVQADLAENARATLQAQQQSTLAQNQAAEAARKLAQANELAGLEAKGVAAAAAATADAYERAARAFAGLRNTESIRVPRSAPELAREQPTSTPRSQRQTPQGGGTVNNIGNLTISTPQPTTDAAKVLQDLSRSAVSGAGL